MNTSSNAENKFHRVCKAQGLTDAGIRWLDYALDPCKDVREDLPSGFPDKVMTNSVVQCVQQQTTVTAPGTTNWDCNIFVDQIWDSLQVQTTNYVANIYAQAGQSGSGYRGGLQVRSATSGIPLTTDFAQPAQDLSLVPDPFNPQVVVGGAETNQSAVRLIGIGMEIHNNTAAIEKQGSVVVWRNMEPCTKTVSNVVLNLTGTACIPTAQETLVMPDVPTTPSEAIDLPGSKIWEAAEGAYIVPVLIKETNPPVKKEVCAIIAWDQDEGVMWYPTIQAPIGTGGLMTINEAVYKTCELPVSCSGAFFSGLSPQTELTVNLTYYIEIFPDNTNVMRRNATPSCPEDMAAIELYTKIARRLPAGVPVKDNFLGAFMAGIANLARAAAPVIANVVRASRAVAKTAGVVGQVVSAVSTATSSGTREIEAPSREIVVRGPRVVEQRDVIVREPRVREIVTTNSSRNNNREIIVVRPRNRDKVITRELFGNAKAARKQTNRSVYSLSKELAVQHAGNRWVNTNSKKSKM